jgi:PAS domain S-box-containing protein
VVAVTALPALWLDRPIELVAESLGSALFSALQPAFLYVRLELPWQGRTLEIARTEAWSDKAERASALGRALAPWLAEPTASAGSETIVDPLGEGSARLSVTPIGSARSYGLVAVGSRRPDSLAEHDRLVLRVATNEAAVALHGAHLSAERDRAEAERVELLDRERAARAEAERAWSSADSERRRLRELFAIVPAVILATAGPEHVVLFANRTLERLSGRDERALVGQPMRTVFSDVEGPGYFELLDRVYATGAPVVVEESQITWQRPGAGTRDEGFFNLALLPVRSADGSVEGVLMHAVDVTEEVRSRQRLEELVIENERLYREARGKAALEERQRLARELHDSVSQALYAIALNASAAEAVRERDPGRLRELIGEVAGLAEAGLAETRALIFELRPESLEREGLVAALEKQAAAVRARHGLDVRCRLGEEPSVSLTVKEVLYRIAQEALQNVVKHARARAVELALADDARGLALRVGDDGVGFDPTGSFPGHLGLGSMRERAAAVGGSVEFESAPGRGTTVVARVPPGRPG